MNSISTPGSAVVASRTRVPPAARQSTARYGRLFIVTYGRSGSTLLQGVLNALPGYLIRGENNDLIAALLELFEKLPRHRERQTGTDAKLKASTPEMPFYGYERFRDDAYALAMGRFVDTMLADDATLAANCCLGFKEIRYSPEDVSDKVDFLRRLYPGCGIVYNIREPEAVAASEFQKHKPVAYFRAFNNVLRDLASVDPHAYLVEYEHLVAGTGTLPGLFDFLGEAFDRRAFDAVLSRKHSYHSPKKGSIYSNVPAAAQVDRALPDLDLFIVDKLSANGRMTKIDGFIVEAPGTPARTFARLVDSRGREIDFTAEYGLASPKIGRQVGTEQAAKSRFRLTFKRPKAEAMTLFFADGKVAVTMPAAGSP